MGRQQQRFHQRARTLPSWNPNAGPQSTIFPGQFPRQQCIGVEMKVGAFSCLLTTSCVETADRAY